MKQCGKCSREYKDESIRIPALKRVQVLSNKETNLNIYCGCNGLRSRYKVERLIPVLLIIKAFLDKV